MKRRPLPVAAVLTATAVLLLTACGSSDSSKSNDKIPGADTSATASAPPSADVTDSAERPKVTLPSDVTTMFEDWQTGDATKDAVLADTSRRINALDYAITEGNADEPALSFYYKGSALAGATNWVKEFVDAKKSMTGETRYFKPRIEVYAKRKAALTYCSFEGKAYLKDRKTEKSQKTPVTNKSYLLYATRLEKNSEGVWQTSTLSSERGSTACTP